MSRQSVKKRIVILKHNGGRLGNQLLLFASVYAFCLEKNYELVNYSFYNYRKYFNFNERDFFTNIVDVLGKLGLYRSHRSHFLVYLFYIFLANLYSLLHPGKTIKALPEKSCLLPPSKPSSEKNLELVNDISKSKDRNIYLEGWTFRNPIGIKKYHQEIRRFFQPNKEIKKNIDRQILSFKKEARCLIGVHIRQGDYKVWQGGKYYYSQKEVFAILENFLESRGINHDDCFFLLCSDGGIDKKIFGRLNFKIGSGNLVEDLFMLSECDYIIGSNSTFGRFAAYYGDKPLYFFDRKKSFLKQPYGF